MDQFTTCIVKGNNFDMTKSVVRGKRGYIPLDLVGTPRENISWILEALEAFEKQRDVKITSWVVDKQQMAYFVRAIVCGIWVEFAPKIP